MSTTDGLRKLRYWNLFVATLDFIAMLVFTILYSIKGIGRTFFLRGYVCFIISGLLFVSYIYSIKGEPRIHKYLRAFLMLFLALFELGINLQVIADNVKLAPPGLRFKCGTYDVCYASNAFLFISVILGFFVILEVGWTLKVGSLQPKNYRAQENVIIVSPLHPAEGYQYPPHQQQQIYGQKIDNTTQAPIELQQTSQPYVQQPLVPQPYTQQPYVQQPYVQQPYYPQVAATQPYY
jgi:hypothetical protein